MHMLKRSTIVSCPAGPYYSMTVMCMIITVTDHDHDQHPEMCIHNDDNKIDADHLHRGAQHAHADADHDHDALSLCI